jgi:hypothetical protein
LQEVIEMFYSLGMLLYEQGFPYFFGIYVNDSKVITMTENKKKENIDKNTQFT